MHYLLGLFLPCKILLELLKAPEAHGDGAAPELHLMNRGHEEGGGEQEASIFRRWIKKAPPLGKHQPPGASSSTSHWGLACLGGQPQLHQHGSNNDPIWHLDVELFFSS